jgi:hypothetical protein
MLRTSCTLLYVYHCWLRKVNYIHACSLLCIWRNKILGLTGMKASVFFNYQLYVLDEYIHLLNYQPGLLLH